MISAPDPSAASMTTVTRARPLISRFRRGKLPTCGRSPGGNSLSRSPSAPDTFIQQSIGGGIDDAQAVAQHTDGGATGVERGSVRDGVQAARHPAHHDDPGRGGVPRDPATRLFAVRRMVPTADDGHRGPLEQREIASRRTAPAGDPECGEGSREIPDPSPSKARPPARSTSSSTRRPASTDVAFTAEAAGLDMPGTVHKNANGAERAPVGCGRP